MTPFLPALIFLGASVQVPQALHFTNQQWDIQPPQYFLIQWAYDTDDFLLYSTWQVAIWLANSPSFPLSNDSDLLYESMPSIADLLI
jgi:hypothetical protein